MSKPKASKSPKPQAQKPQAPKPQALPIAPEEDVGDELNEASPTQLGAENVAFLGRVYTLLFNITRFLERARRQGYTQKEHDLGWEYWSVASGKNRPFEHWLAEHDQREQTADISTERMRVLQEIDTFENLWFPRMRALIARVIPKESAPRFAAAFFKDLSQQPLGPAVVDSVKTFLKRVEELKTSSEPGAGDLFKTLAERGLTPKKIESMRGLIAAAEEHKAPGGGAPPVSPEEIAEAKRAQLAAVESMKLWYNDWATTFRGVFGHRAQIALGLTALRRRKAEDGSAGDEEDEDAEEEDEDAEDAEGDEGDEEDEDTGTKGG